jgi:hypothetical protein
MGELWFARRLGLPIGRAASALRVVDEAVLVGEDDRLYAVA